MAKVAKKIMRRILEIRLIICFQVFPTRTALEQARSRSLVYLAYLSSAFLRSAA